MAKSLRNKVNNLKCHLKKNYGNDAISFNVHDSKKLWKIIKTIKSSSASNVVEINKGTSSTKETVNVYNDYFTSILVMTLHIKLTIVVVMILFYEIADEQV